MNELAYDRIIDFFGAVIVAEVGRFSAEFIYRNRSSIFTPSASARSSVSSSSKPT
ncbi:MAG: hypothetical protein K6G84_02020 [Lachnospiraceae bacterium]|nr:hypothetical protein [Lachnospiraceae bacterium]